MTISATIVADSISTLWQSELNANRAPRLTSWVLVYPRFIHAEVMTHRMLSRNASSSRAIPVAKQIDRIMADPAMPVSWGVNKPGMQASEVLTPEQEEAARALWLAGRDTAVRVSRSMALLNVHKQIVNRIAEPWSHMATVVTGTEWENFFTLRHHPDAQPEFQVLAEKMAAAYRESIPRCLSDGEWHLPFVNFDDEASGADTATLIKYSVARCARVSYLNHDGTAPDAAKDIALHDKLVVSRPLHASPAEHQATPFCRHSPRSIGSPWKYPYDLKWNPALNDGKGALDMLMPWSANFRGFFQYRQSLRNQNSTTFPWQE